MPNQKSNKGKRNKRTNSSGDEQENGASAAATVGAPGVTTLLGATAAPLHEHTSGKCEIVKTCVTSYCNGFYCIRTRRQAYVASHIIVVIDCT